MSDSVMNLTAAAATAVGPIGAREKAQWQAEVLQAALALHQLASPRGPIGKYLDGIARVEDHVANQRPKLGKIFVATVHESRREERTGRALITLTSYNDKTGEWKQEVCRTDFLSNSDGLGLRLAKMARDLVGHKVRVWIELEPKQDGSGESVRMLRHLEDLGIDKQYQQGT